MAVDSLYICPWSLRDPLCVSQSLAYVRGLTEKGYSFALVTFENGRYPISAEEHANVTQQLAEENIAWHPINWNQGTSLFSKLFSIVGSLFSGVRICIRHRPKLIHSRSSLPAFMAVSLAKIFNTRFLYDADSVLSDEYADIGYMQRGSYGLRFLAWSERFARRNADQMIVLTEVLKNDLKDQGAKVPIEVIPCCVDTEKFRFDENARSRRRSELGLGDEVLAVYVGKAGSWYMVGETFDLFARFVELHPEAKLLILSPDAAEVFDEIAESRGVPNSSYFHRHAAPSEVPEWLSASDVGFSLIRQLPSKRGSSPVKFPEYLSCQLPVVLTSGIGDCSEIARSDSVGIVIENVDEKSLQAAAKQLNDLLMQNSDALAVRCRETAKTKFDLNEVARARYLDIYSRMLPRIRTSA